MKHKVGDTVRIIGNISEHHFLIGEEIKIIKVNHIEYYCKGDSHDYWHCQEEDVQGISEPIPLNPIESFRNSVIEVLDVMTHYWKQ
jgi:hypothetical protein